MKVIKAVVLILSIVAIESFLSACPTCVFLKNAQNQQEETNHAQKLADANQVGEMENSHQAVQPRSTNASHPTVKKIMAVLRLNKSDQPPVAEEDNESNPVQDGIDADPNGPLKILDAQAQEIYHDNNAQ